jgi:hypothetical protein
MVPNFLPAKDTDFSPIYTDFDFARLKRVFPSELPNEDVATETLTSSFVNP